MEDVGFQVVDSMYGGKTTLRTLGTAGSIYRVDVIRQIRGFDDDLTGVGEDMNVEHRIRRIGWSTYLGSPALCYERRRNTWKDLWKENSWHGYGGHKALCKNPHIFAHYKMTPLAGLIAGVWYSIIAYKLTHRKIVFLLPLQYTFKKIAWSFGFLKGQIERR